jgi:methyl-accepting chemotaxis protein
LGDNEDIKNNLTASFGDSMALLGEDFGTLGDAVDATVSSLAEFVENMDFESLEVELLKLETPWENISSATLQWNTALEESLGIIENIASAMDKVYEKIGVADPELFAETVAAEITGSMGETSVLTSGGRKNVSLGDIIDVTNQANTADVN